MKKRIRKPYQSTPARIHQFRRFRAKGLFAAAKTSFRDIWLDKEHFTSLERSTAYRIANMCGERLRHWENILSGKELKL